MDFYHSSLKQHTEKANLLTRQLSWLSFIRILFFVAFIFFVYKAVASSAYFTFAAIAALAIFLFMIRLYDKWQYKVAFCKALVRINENEISFLNGQASAYDTGKEFTDPHHPYSYDLDLFGEGGLFQYLNRASTSFGEESLSQLLLHPDTKNIRERQKAVLELANKPVFRQNLQAYGMMRDTTEREMQQLRSWMKSGLVFPNKTVYYLLWLFPLATLTTLGWYIFSENDSILNVFFTLFLVDLAITGLFGKKIAAHLSVSTSVTSVLQQFSLQLHQLESESFLSSQLKMIQERLKTANIPASKSIAKLSSLFNALETFLNVFVSPFLNGFFLFHIHVLYKLENWKKQYSGQIIPWLQVLGDAEALSSLANLSFNNPSFCRPEPKETEALSAVEMGHPLIRAKKRITNSISFNQHPFVILTGSNMSGKSTFLRTLGINMVLARSGSVVCAKEFEFYPYAVQVSMRISDSLQDSESFFYAELKRLQHIIHELQSGVKTFILLDEILRGTNSNDKHSGTVGLIHKLVAAHACGIIATHDLTVSKLSAEYPSYISNKCFESQIINDELFFDYKLKDDVCTTLSASFLMKKMGVI